MSFCCILCFCVLFCLFLFVCLAFGFLFCSFVVDFWLFLLRFTGTAETSEHWGVRGGGGGGRLIDLSSGYEIMLPLNIFKSKFLS